MSRQAGPRIVVVGAGVAGLAAARTLIRHGFDNVLVLEAQDRIGGRVHTITHGDESGVLELGAQWIHGQGSNPLFRLAVQQGLVDSETSGAEGSGEYRTSEGDRIMPELVEELQEVMEAADDSCGHFLDDGVDMKKIPASVEHHFRSTFTEHLTNRNSKDGGDIATQQRNRKSDDGDVAGQLSGLFRWHLLFQCLDNACHHLERVSAATWGEFRLFEGEHWVNLRGGYDSVVQELAAALPDGTIRRRTTVSCIHRKGRSRWSDWTDDNSSGDDETRHNAINGVKFVHFRNSVTTHILPDDVSDDGTTDVPDHDAASTTTSDDVNTRDVPTSANRDDVTRPRPVRLVCEDGSEHVADHVMVTVSLGVLKRCHRQMFRPSLPDVKCKVIEAMGFGTLNKIFLVFERPFWGDAEGFQLVWTDADRLCLRNDDGAEEAKYEWYRDITGFDVVLNQPNVLVGWIGRRGGEIMESIPELQVGRTCAELLRRFTGITSIPDPQKVIRSSWKSNPYFGGSYSNRTVQCDEEGVHTSDLARPVYIDGQDGRRLPVLLFAGEATDTNYFSTVHGAFMSGEREARRLISYYTCCKMPKHLPTEVPDLND